ncbi:tyrosine-type recombinase/integrase, partial [uncultured Oscillibacter sp.]|uniref:site-specific integrase n=1 Tax=uncultured Oscillibacter sp. TaxID=876091 RepID=UPI00280BE9A4
SIRDIKVSDAQKWIMKLHEDGKGYSTLTSVRGVVKPAFQMAYNEDVIRRNPFDFKLIDVVSNDSQKRIAMTEEQQTLWMDFIRKDKTYCKYYDEFVVLLGTGMRVSEFCGLTKADLDFTGRKIRVENPGGSSACPGARRQVLCGENQNRVRLPLHSYDGRGLQEPAKHSLLPQARENGNDHRRVQRVSSAGQER